MVGAARILPSYSLQIVKGDHKELSEGSGKPLPLRKEGAEGKARVKSP